MSYRFMRIIVMFDLPVEIADNRKEYNKFRKHLIKTGFLIVQESIYCKLAPNSNTADSIAANIRKHKPSQGLVQILRITEKQYSKMEFIVGKNSSEIVDTDERVIIL